METNLHRHIQRQDYSFFQNKDHISLTATWKGESHWHSDHHFGEILSAIFIKFKGFHGHKSLWINIPSLTCTTEKQLFFKVDHLSKGSTDYQNLCLSVEQLKTISIASYILCEKPNGKIIVMNYQKKGICPLYDVKKTQITLPSMPTIESGFEYELQFSSEKPFELKASLIKKEKNVTSIKIANMRHTLLFNIFEMKYSEDKIFYDNRSISYDQNNTTTCCDWFF